MELDIDDELRRRLAARAERAEFESTEAYCVAVLRTVVEELDDGRSDERADAVTDRLEDLGYL
jgi:hypothetical protein